MKNRLFLILILGLTIALALSSNTGALISLPGGGLPGGGVPGVTLTPPIEFNVSSENKTVINFESLTDSSISNLTYQIVAYGVFFPNGIEVLDCEFLRRCDSARSGARVIRSSDLIDEFSRRPLTIEFSSPKKLVELYAKYDYRGVFTVTASLNAYDREGSPVGSDTRRFSTTGAWQKLSVGSSSGSARITRVVLSGGPDGVPPTNFFLVDDLGFEGDVTRLPPDTSSPVVTILSPASGLEFTTSSISVGFRASDDRLIKRIDMSVFDGNGTLFFEGNDCGTAGRGACGNPVEKTISATLDRGAGNYRITITACDTSDNCGSDSVSITYIPPPPPPMPVAHRVQIFQGADDRLERTGRPLTPSLISKSNLLHGSNTTVRYYLLGEGGPISRFSEWLHIIVHRADGSVDTYTIPVATANLPEDPMNESLRNDLFDRMLTDNSTTLDFIIPGEWLENVEYLDLRLGGRGGLSWEQVSGFRRGDLVKISGFLEYEEDDGRVGETDSRGFKPIRYSKVILKKLARGYPTAMTTITDRNGYFEFVLPRTIGGRYRLELKAGNYAVRVERDYDLCNKYVWWVGNHTIEIPESGRGIEIGTLRVGINTNIDFFGRWQELDCVFHEDRGWINGGSAYFNIAETIRLVREYAQDPANRDEPQSIGKVYVAYPDDGPFNYFRGAAAGTPWTNPFWDEIYLSSPFENRDLGFVDETIVHEYTHHLSKEISENNLALMGHSRCARTGNQFAWFEGFAEYMSHLILKKYRNDPDYYLSQERTWFNLAETPDCPVNKEVEGGIVNVLWDLVDEPGPDFPNSIIETFDNISGEDSVIFKIFDTEMDRYINGGDICDFVTGEDGWKRRFAGDRRATDIDPILGEYNITC